MSGPVGPTFTSSRDGDVIKVSVFGIPARHTHKRREATEEHAYGMLYRAEVAAMSRRETHYLIRFEGSAFETYTYRIVEVPA